MKYYFTKKQPGFCYTLEYWKQEMEEAQRSRCRYHRNLMESGTKTKILKR